MADTLSVGLIEGEEHVMAKDQIEDFNVDDGDEKDLDQYGVWVSSDTQDDHGSETDSSLLDIDEGLGDSDDLGDLNDLLMSIDEDGDNEDTIYLEEEDLSLDLDAGTSDLFDGGDLDDGNGLDGLGDLKIPSLDGDEINLSMDDDDFTIPELEDSSPATDSLDLAMEDLASSPTEDEDLLGEDFGLEAPTSLDLEEETVSTIVDDKNEFVLDPDTDLESDLELSEDDTELGGISDFSSDLGDLGDEVDFDSDSLDISIEPSEEPSDPEISDFSLDTIESPEESFDDISAVTNEMFGETSDTTQGTSSHDSFDDISLEDDFDVDSTDELALDEETVIEDTIHEAPVPEPVVQKVEQAPSVAPTPTVQDSSAGTVLLSIEKELHAIRSELTDLRSELQRLRSKPLEVPSGDMAPVPTIQDVVSPQEYTFEDDEVKAESENLDSPKGFFEDDEDETIALTGDELDNILNSAEFTEEAGQPSEVDDESDLGISAIDEAIEPDLPSSEPLVGYEEAKDSIAPPIEEIVLEEIQDIDDELAVPTDEFTEDFVEEVQSTESNNDSHDAVESMANLDIEKELAGIEDLSDSEGDMELFTDDELSDIEIDVLDETSSTAQPVSMDLPEDVEEEIILDELSDETTSEDLDISEDLSEDVSPIEPSPSMEEFENESEVVPEPVRTPLTSDMPHDIKQDLRAVLEYMDKLLDSLPQEKIEDFAKSEHFEVYKKLFEELGI